MIACTRPPGRRALCSSLILEYIGFIISVYGMKDEQRALFPKDMPQLSVPRAPCGSGRKLHRRRDQLAVEQPHDSGSLCPQAPVQRASGHLTPTMGTSMDFWSQTPSAQVMVLQQTSLVSGPCHLLTCRRSRSCECLRDDNGGDGIFGVSVS